MSPRAKKSAKKTDPQLFDLPARRMAVVRATGNPDQVFPSAMPALYGSVYTLKFDLKKKGLETFKVEPPRARYPDAPSKPTDEWTILLGIPVPDNTAVLPQKVPATKVALETWEYGQVAQILHLGAYDQETESINRLHAFVAGQGYRLAGPHEEEYLSRPDAKVVKTLIRYQVKRK